MRATSPLATLSGKLKLLSLFMPTVPAAVKPPNSTRPPGACKTPPSKRTLPPTKAKVFPAGTSRVGFGKLSDAPIKLPF